VPLCLCAPQDLQSLFPKTIPPTISFFSCSADLTTSQPRTTQQTQTSNIQYQLHLSTCLFSLLIVGNKSNVSSSLFTSSLEYGSHLLSYFSFILESLPQTACHPLRHMMKAERVWLLFTVSIAPSPVLMMLLKRKGLIILLSVFTKNVDHIFCR